MPKIPSSKAHTRSRAKKSIVHPNSRRAAQLTRDQAHRDRIEKRKHAHDTAVSEKVSKLVWFREHIDDSRNSYVYGEVVKLIEDDVCNNNNYGVVRSLLMEDTVAYCINPHSYLGRLDDELDELVSKQGLPHQKGRRHASREDQIRSTMLQERHLLQGPGFEAPDLTEPKAFKTFISWQGEEHLLPTLKLRKYRAKPPPSPPAVTTASNKALTDTNTQLE